MRVLVLGGTRFIGRFVVDHLVNAGAEVAVFHRGDTEPTDLAAVAHLHGDRRQMEDHRNEFAKLAPEVIIDMLPMNATDARTVQRTLSGVAGRIVAVSSQDVYRAYAVLRRQEPGPLQTLPITEGAALRSNLYPYRDEFAAGHPLVEGLLAHLEESARGRVSVLRVALGPEKGLGLLALARKQRG